MPSSTSSFETYELKRIVPKHHWMLLALLSVVITASLTLGWELYCRSLGYEPSLNDSTDLWASRRMVLDTAPSRTVLIGSSRILFDFNMDVYEQGMGERPLQLATVGTNPLGYLEDLADHPQFSGTVIVGVVPGFLWLPPVLPWPLPRNTSIITATGAQPGESHTMPLVFWTADWHF